MLRKVGEEVRKILMVGSLLINNIVAICLGNTHQYWLDMIAESILISMCRGPLLHSAIITGQ